MRVSITVEQLTSDCIRFLFVAKCVYEPQFYSSPFNCSLNSLFYFQLKMVWTVLVSLSVYLNPGVARQAIITETNRSLLDICITTGCSA